MSENTNQILKLTTQAQALRVFYLSLYAELGQGTEITLAKLKARFYDQPMISVTAAHDLIAAGFFVQPHEALTANTPLLLKEPYDESQLDFS